MAHPVPRMDGSQAAAWIALVSVAELLPQALDAQLTADAGIINFEYGILSVLNVAEGRCFGMNELRRTLRAPAPRLSKAVSRLEARGLVERVHGGSEDGRAVEVRMTHEGRKTWLKATPPHIAFAREHVLGALTPEQLEELGRLLDPIVQCLDPGRELGRLPRPGDEVIGPKG